MDLNKNQKIFSIILGAILLASLSFGIYQIRENVYGPMRTSEFEYSVTELNQEIQKRSLAYILSLQQTDSDKDTISDYDEMYEYNTSPFLADTDSDGIDDNIELANGQDPTCHKDKDCAAELVITVPDQIVELQNQLPDYDQFDESILQELPTNLSAAEIRALLLESGFTQEQVQAFSDQELTDAWESALE